MKNENQSLAYICIFLMCFGYVMWFFAEADNQQLRRELISIKYKALSEVSVGDLHAYSND